ncbi:MAG: hypothetical protein ABIJ45_11830 [Candidatus Zixiibacteriota bacterium]
MQCSFCGKELDDKPIRQGTGVYCSIGCADLANDIDRDETNYYDDEGLDGDFSSDYDNEYYEGDDGMPY